jgi:hypothetical protein
MAEMLWFRVRAQPSFPGNNKRPSIFVKIAGRIHSDWTEIHVGAALRTFGVHVRGTRERDRMHRCAILGFTA